MIIPSGSQHLQFSILVVILLFIKIEFSLAMAIYILIGSLLPDCDTRHGTIAKVLPLYLLGIKHAGATHTIIANSLFFIAYWYTKNEIWLGLGIGYSTHLYIDNLDGNKLKYLYYPIRRRRKK